MTKANPFPMPTTSTAIILASIAVHAEEFIGPHGHPHDREAILSLLSDPETGRYLTKLGKLGLLPVKRQSGETRRV